LTPSINTRALRRSVISALGTREPMRARTRLILAAAILLASYATKSLQAVDLVPRMYTAEQYFSGLSVTYDQRAVSILRGEGLLGPYDVDPSDATWVSQAPGYSIFLSAVYAAVGRDFYKVQLVQNALNSISAVLIFLIAGHGVSWRVGAVAGFIAALSHHLSHISNFILPDSLVALPILAAVCLLTMARRYGNHSYWLYSLAGILFGLSAWLRSQVMMLGLFALVMLTLIAVRRWPAVKRAALMAAVSVLVIAPITIKNYIVYDTFIPIQVGTGVTLWEGIGDYSDRFGAVRTDEEVGRQEAILYNDPRYAESNFKPNGIERDRERVRKSLEVIRNNPFWYAGVMLDRMREMVKYSAQAPLVFRAEQARSQQRVAPIMKEWISLASERPAISFAENLFWMRSPIRSLQRLTKEAMQAFILLGAVVLGFVSLRRSLFLSIVPIYYLLFQSLTHTEFRYTLPMHYFLFVMAATVWVLLGVGVFRGLRALWARIGSK
jgi:dolichyl-phosphate-mannose-protein mannosyltransferase